MVNAPTNFGGPHLLVVNVVFVCVFFAYFDAFSFSWACLLLVLMLLKATLVLMMGLPLLRLGFFGCYVWYFRDLANVVFCLFVWPRERFLLFRFSFPKKVAPTPPYLPPSS